MDDVDQDDKKPKSRLSIVMTLGSKCWNFVKALDSEVESRSILSLSF